MATSETKTFAYGDGVAVVLPADCGFDADIKVVIERTGDVVTIRRANPADRSQEVLSLIEALEGLPVSDPAGHEAIDFQDRRDDF